MLKNVLITDVGFIVVGVVGRVKILYVVGGWQWVVLGREWKVAAALVVMVELMLVVLLVIRASTMVGVGVVEMIRSGGGGGWLSLVVAVMVGKMSSLPCPRYLCVAVAIIGVVAVGVMSVVAFVFGFKF